MGENSPAQLDLNHVELKARHTFSEDGLHYIMIGIMLAAVGLSWLDSRWVILVGLSLFLAVPLERIRRRVTYPRIGYAQFVTPQGTWRGIVGFAVVAFVVLMVVVVVLGGRFADYAPIFMGIVVGLAMYFGFSMQGIDWVAGFLIGATLLSGFVAVYLFDDWHTGAAAQFVTLGLLFVVVGLVQFVRFVHYPVLDEAALTEDE